MVGRGYDNEENKSVNAVQAEMNGERRAVDFGAKLLAYYGIDHLVTPRQIKRILKHCNIWYSSRHHVGKTFQFANYYLPADVAEIIKEWAADGSLQMHIESAEQRQQDSKVTPPAERVQQPVFASFKKWVGGRSGGSWVEYKDIAGTADGIWFTSTDGKIRKKLNGSHIKIAEATQEEIDQVIADAKSAKAAAAAKKAAAKAANAFKEDNMHEFKKALRSAMRCGTSVVWNAQWALDRRSTFQESAAAFAEQYPRFQLSTESGFKIIGGQEVDLGEQGGVQTVDIYLQKAS